MASGGVANPRRVGPFSSAVLRRMARTPSMHAPRVRDMHDPDAFPTVPVAGADLSGRAFLAHGCDGDAVRLVAVQPFVGELARCPHLAGVRRLDLSGNRIGVDGVRALAGSPYLAGLRELDLSGNDLGPDGAAVLAAAPWFRQLTGVSLADNRLGTADLPALHPLDWLDLSDNPLGAVTLPTVRRLRAAGSGLRTIDLPAGVADLDLSRNRLDPAGLRFPRSLETLDVSHNDFGGEIGGVLSGEFPAVRVLNLAGDRLTAVPDLRRFPALADLDLSCNPLGDGIVVRMPGLTRLNLSNTGVADAGVRRLDASGLRSLALAWNPLTDAGIWAFAGRPDLADLRDLDLSGTGVGFAGAVALADSPHLGQLERLRVGHNPRLPADGVVLLRERFGTILEATGPGFR